MPHLVPGAPDARGFRLVAVDAETGSPVRYNACEPVHYVINPSLAPSGGIDDVHRAFELAANATGMQFVDDGTTDEVATPDREPWQPDRYGDRWAPILISWANGIDEDAHAQAAGQKTVGLGGSYLEVNEDGTAVFVTGTATFDASVTDIPSGFGGQTWGQVFLHELGHVLGLAHVESPDSVMNPVQGLRPAMWGSGDLAGLWTLGLGSPCVATPETP